MLQETELDRLRRRRREIDDEIERLEEQEAKRIERIRTSVTEATEAALRKVLGEDHTWQPAAEASEMSLHCWREDCLRSYRDVRESSGAQCDWCGYSAAAHRIPS